MKRFLPILFCLLLITLAACRLPAVEPEPAATDVPAATDEPVATDAPAVTDAPEAPQAQGDLVFDTVTLSGEPIDSSILHDYDLIIVNCWAEWCGPCVGELPELERIYEEYPNVLILGVLSFSYDMAGAKAVLADAGVTYPAFEPAGTLIARVETFDAIPTTMFFDRSGNEIAEPIVGSMDYNGWKTTVEGLLP